MTIFISVLLNALVTIALLLVTRARLARQFFRLEGRLNQLERSFIELRQARERERTAEQLQRLHRGLVRLHESTAERFGPLEVLARDFSRRDPRGQLFPGEFLLADLGEWAAALGVSLRRDDLTALARAIPWDQAPPASGLEEIVPLLRRSRAAITVSVSPADESARRAQLAALVPIFFSAVHVTSTKGAGTLDAMMAVGAYPPETALGGLKPGGLLIVSSLSPSPDQPTFPDVSGFTLLAGREHTAVYEKNSAARG